MSMTYNELVTQCKALRAAHERAEAQFLLFLMRAELECCEVWREAGCTDFDQFIRSNHLCEVQRYRFFAVGIERSSVDDALSNGAHWTVTLGMAPRPTSDFVEGFKARAVAFVATERVAPSEQTVRQWRAELSVPTREHGTIRKASELDRLREENRRLTAELTAAKARIAELEGQGRTKKHKAA